MDELEHWEGLLYSRAPLTGARIRRRAVEKLAAMDPEAVVDILANAVVHSNDRRVREKALTTLATYAPTLIIERVEPIAQAANSAALVQLVLNSLPDGSLAEHASWLVTSDRAWEMVVDVSRESADWDILWRLCMYGSPLQALTLLTLLAEQTWRPEKDSVLFETLLEQAARCKVLSLPMRWQLRQMILCSSMNHMDTCHFTPDGNYLVTRHTREILLWKLPNADFHARIPITGQNCNYSVMSARSDQIWIGAYNCPRIWLYSLGDDAGLIHSFENEAPITAFAVSADDQLAYHGDREGHLTVWDVAQRTRIGRYAISTKPVSNIAVSKDGKWLATQAKEEVALWALPEVHKVEEFTRERVPNMIRFSADSKLLIINHNNLDGTRGVEVPSGKILWEHPYQRWRSFALLPDGEGICAGIYSTLRWYKMGDKEPYASLPFRAKRIVHHPTEGLFVGIVPDGFPIFHLWGESALHQLLHKPLGQWVAADVERSVQEMQNDIMRNAELTRADRAAWIEFCQTLALLNQRHDVWIDESQPAQPYDIQIDEVQGVSDGV